MSDWEELFEHGGERIGGALLEFVLQPEQWILRRVEEITVSSRSLVRRAVSLDIVLPADWDRLKVDQADLNNPYVVLPLGFMEKRQLVDFDLQEGSQRLSLLRGSSNSQIARGILWSVARVSGLPAPSADAAGPWFRRIAGFDPDDAQLAFDELFGNGPLPPVAAREIRSSKYQGVRTAAIQFRDAYLLLSELDPRGTRRHLVRFSTEQEISSDVPPLANRLAWRPNTLEFSLPGASQAASYHVEVVVPDGCRIEEMTPIDAAIAPSLDNEAVLLGRRSARYVLPLSDRRAGLLVAISPETRFFLLPAFWVAVLVGATLAFGAAITAWSESSDVQAAAATLVLSGLSVIAGFVFRADDGPLTSELHGPARAVLSVVAVTAVAAAAAVAFGAARSDLTWSWGVLSLIAFFGAAILGRAAFR